MLIFDIFEPWLLYYVIKIDLAYNTFKESWLAHFLRFFP